MSARKLTDGVSFFDATTVARVRQGLRNDTGSVRLSVRLCHLAPQPRRTAGLLLWARQAGDIAIGGAGSRAAAAPQHGAQQQMRGAVPRLQPTYEAG